MNTPESINSECKNVSNIIYKNWDNLDASQKSSITKIWKDLTYKWQFQIIFNLHFLIWWGLDKSITKVHNFDVAILSYLNLPEWVISFIGFGK